MHPNLFLSPTCLLPLVTMREQPAPCKVPNPSLKLSPVTVPLVLLVEAAWADAIPQEKETSWYGWRAPGGGGPVQHKALGLIPSTGKGKE